MSYSNAKWVGGDLNPEQVRCLETICAVQRAYNLVHYLAGATTEEKFVFSSAGLVVRFKRDLSTFDGDGLTRLVLAAHRNAVRVQISPRSRFSVEIRLHVWGSERPAGERHPTMEDVLGSN